MKGKLQNEMLFSQEATTNPLRFLDKTSVSVIGAFLMDPGGGAEHPKGAHDPLGWAVRAKHNTTIFGVTLDSILRIA